MTGCADEKIVPCGPSHRSQCGELTDSHAITMHSSQAATQVVALTVGFIPESYFPEHSGGDPTPLPNDSRTWLTYAPCAKGRKLSRRALTHCTVLAFSAGALQVRRYNHQCGEATPEVASPHPASTTSTTRGDSDAVLTLSPISHKSLRDTGRSSSGCSRK